MSDEQDPYESTTRWLQELAQRPAVRQCAAAPVVQPPARPPRRAQSLLGVGREIYLFAVMAAAFGNYYFIQVMVEMDSLPSLIVFVAHSGQL